MKFREHRGSLEDSMATVVEIGNTFTDVCKHARTVLTSMSGGLEPGELLLPTPIKLSAFSDTRIGWEGFTVSLVGWGVVGFIDDVPEDTPPEVFTDVQRSAITLGQGEFDTSLVETMYPEGSIEVVGLAAEPDETLVNELLDEGLRTMGTYNGADFFAQLKALIEEGENQKAINMIECLPHALSPMLEVTKGTVVLPDAEHMSEAMVDATRGMHLYYMEAGSGVNCSQMRKHLSRYAPWAEKHYPQWFRDDNSHLTKGGRAILAHALTIGAHKDPDAREYYFKAESIRRQRVWDNPMHQRIRMTFKPMVMGEVFDDGGFVIHKPFMEARPIGNDKFALQLNRSDMPKVHRGKFKTEAFTLVLELTEEGMNVNFLEWQVNPKLASSSYEVIPAMASRW